MKKTGKPVLFCCTFLFLLVLPLVTANFESGQRSDIDNTLLPELNLSSPQQFSSDMEVYANARIGLREEMIHLYELLNLKLFGVLEHPHCMYGEEGYIFYKLDRYILDYQRLNLNPEWEEHFTATMLQFQQIAAAHDAGFLYMLLPDKKSVYAEYFSKDVIVHGDRSRTECLLEALEEKQVNHFFPLELLLETKKTMPVANVRYDPGHWNENGAFVTYLALYRRMQTFLPELTMLSADEFEVQQVMEGSIPFIPESVPLYVQRSTTAVADHALLSSKLPFLSDEWDATRYVNPALPDAPKILVIHDSYMGSHMGGHEKFFTAHFSEVNFIHRYNITGTDVFEQCLTVLEPDMVIYENPERSLPINFTGEIEVEGN